MDYDPLDAVLDPVAAAADAGARPQLLVRRRRRRDGRGRARPAPDLPLPALHLHAGRVLRRRRRLGRDRRPADGVGQLPGAVHAARRRRRRTRAQGRPAAPADAARLGWLVRDQVVRVRVRRVDGARRPAPRRAGDLDRGPARAPRGERRRDGPHDRGRGRLHRRRAAARAPLRRDRGRRRVRPGARAGDPLPHARLALGRVHRPERRRAEPRRAHEHDPLRVSTVASAGRSSTSGSSGRWRSPRAASASIPPSSRAAT